jgi:hypothetical protein
MNPVQFTDPLCAAAVSQYKKCAFYASAFKELDPIAQFKATAKLGEFLEARFSQSF